MIDVMSEGREPDSRSVAMAVPSGPFGEEERADSRELESPTWISGSSHSTVACSSLSSERPRPALTGRLAGANVNLNPASRLTSSSVVLVSSLVRFLLPWSHWLKACCLVYCRSSVAQRWSHRSYTVAGRACLLRCPVLLSRTPGMRA
jgi:hypothetical protein